MTLQERAPYQVFILVLSFWAVAAIATSAVVTLDPATAQILQYLDNIVCAVFFVDFVVTLYGAPNRGRYFVTWGWIDLLSSIPAVDVLRWGRFARILRILRLLRAAKATFILARAFRERRAESAGYAAVLLVLLLLFGGSLGILYVERGAADANILSAQDAAWWSITTMSTVGYGDRFPVTPAGRLIAAVLMVAGVGAFAAFSGVVVSWLLSPAEREEESDLAEIKARLAEIQRRLDEKANP